MVLQYTAELRTTRGRATGTGAVAACTKFGGVLGPPLVAWVGTTIPGLLPTALIAATPFALAGLLVLRYGTETRGRELF